MVGTSKDTVGAQYFVQKDITSDAPSNASSIISVVSIFSGYNGWGHDIGTTCAVAQREYKKYILSVGSNYPSANCVINVLWMYY